MINQTAIGIIAIGIIIPLSSFAILNSDQSLEQVETPIHNQQIVVLTSFYPLHEFTKAVGGNKVEVSLVVPSGVEPHDWEPSIQDLQKIQQADLIVINGIGFENWVDDIDSINSNVVIVDTSVGISLIERESEEEADEVSAYLNSKNLKDSHIWLNPVFAKKQVENIAKALIKIDPLNEKYYRTNANSYKAELDFLDHKIRTELSSCATDFIAFHNSFSYFANHYGLNQHTILNSNVPHEDPTSKTLEKVINLARELKIKTIFSEEAVDIRTSQIIANEIGAKVLMLSPLEVVDMKISYIEKMEQNLQNLKEALCN